MFSESHLTAGDPDDVSPNTSLDPASTLDAGRRPCDYVLVTRAELDTLRGSRLLQRVSARKPWTEVAEGGGFVVFAATPDPDRTSK